MAGELLLVVGAVGCGKSTLLSGMLGEAARAGAAAVPPLVAYCAQQAWIENKLVVDNITFGQPFDA